MLKEAIKICQSDSCLMANECRALRADRKIKESRISEGMKKVELEYNFNQAAARNCPSLDLLKK